MPSHRIKYYQKKLRKNKTSSEKEFEKKLRSFEIKFISQKAFKFNDKNYIADYFLTKTNVIIEIDGGYHATDLQSYKDRERDRIFAANGFKVIRLKNNEINDLTKTKLNFLITK